MNSPARLLLLLLSIPALLTACGRPRGGGGGGGDDDDTGDDDTGDDDVGDDDAGDDDAGDDDTGDDDTAPDFCASAPALSGAASLAVGASAFAWDGVDLDGGRTDLCTLGGRPLLVVVSAGWCGPCNDFASGMSGGAHGFGPALDAVRGAVQDGSLAFAEILVDPWSDYGPATSAFLQQWESEYPVPQGLLLGDDSGDSQGQGEEVFPFIGDVAGWSVPFAMMIGADYRYEALGMEQAVSAAAAYAR